VLIAILDVTTAGSDRPAALAQLDGERDEVRAMPGNVAFRVYASRADETRITVVHEWDDEASFAGYLGSDSFVRSGEVLRPIMTGAPVSRRSRPNCWRRLADRITTGPTISPCETADDPQGVQLRAHIRPGASS
jgi:quinol monooxygenase YgiN